MSKDRLSPLDASFLHLEDAYVAHARGGRAGLRRGVRPRTSGCWRTSSRASAWCRAIGSGWPQVPFAQARPRWVDDERFDLRYHVRHTALPAPGSEYELQVLAGRVFSQPLRRDRPLWEMWLVEGLDAWPLRDPLQDAPRARRRRLGPGHPERAVRARRGGAPEAVAPAAGAVDRRAAGRGAARARDGRRRARCGRCAPRCAGRAGRSAGSRRPRSAPVRWRGRAAAGAADALQRRPGRPRPAVHVDARVARRRQGDQERARRDRQRRRADRRHARAAPAPDAARRGHRRARAEGVRPGERAQPRTSAERSATRSRG